MDNGQLIFNYLLRSAEISSIVLSQLTVGGEEKEEEISQYPTVSRLQNY